MPVPELSGILARGPWSPDSVHAEWDSRPYTAPPERVDAADRAIAALRARNSPSHDGTAGRLVDWEQTADGLQLRLQPMRWALRLDEDDTSASISALCVVRDHTGRWLAGRRAAWLSSWAGRWSLGAGGAVDVGESPAHTLVRELQEEWSVTAEHLQVEWLSRTPNGMLMLVGQAWLAEGAEVVRDPEHDEHAWWPADPDRWPPEAHARLRETARALAERR